MATEILDRENGDLGDGRLVALSQAGEVDAFELLVRRHAPGLLKLLRGYLRDDSDADDVSQEAFVRAWRKIGSFKGDSNFFTWLARIAINESNRHLTRRASRAVRDTEAAEAVRAIATGSAPGLESLVLRHDAARRLERGVGALPVKYRAAVILRDVEGYSTQEAAAMIGVGEAALKSRLHRGRMLLRKSLGDEFGTELGTDD